MPSTDSRSAHTLAATDFVRYPVWRYCADENAGDESQIKPVEPADFRLGAHASFIVAAYYDVGARLTLPGAVQVDVLDRHIQCTPDVIHVEGFNVDPLARGAAARLSRLTGEAGARPRRWTLALPLFGEPAPRSGRIARALWGRSLGLLLDLLRLRQRRLRGR